MNELEKYRGRDGIINLNRLNIELNDFNSFYYNGKKYYIKWSEKVLLLNELVAAEIAKDFGIPSVSYDYARFDFNAFYNGECVISESAFKENDKFYYLREITGDNVTLEDIWNALENKYRDLDVVSILMDEIVNVFLFDILIANDDRHGDNFCIVENEKGVHVAPLFDNEYLLCDNSIDFQYYAMKVDSGNTYYRFVTQNLDRFLQISDERYLERLQSKLWIISSENLDSIFARIKMKTGLSLSEDYQEETKKGFEKNYNMIKDAIQRVNGKRKTV